LIHRWETGRVFIYFASVADFGADTARELAKSAKMATVFTPKTQFRAF
jgi:hypothetical protein